MYYNGNMVLVCVCIYLLQFPTVIIGTRGGSSGFKPYSAKFARKAGGAGSTEIL